MPPATGTARGNTSDHTQVIPLVLDFPEIDGKTTPPRGALDELTR